MRRNQHCLSYFEVHHNISIQIQYNVIIIEILMNQLSSNREQTDLYNNRFCDKINLFFIHVAMLNCDNVNILLPQNNLCDWCVVVIVLNHPVRKYKVFRLVYQYLLNFKHVQILSRACDKVNLIVPALFSLFAAILTIIN